MNTQNTETITCPSCDEEFEMKRTNQKYCSRTCQKNATRGPRAIENRTRGFRHYERALRLAEMLYSVPPAERLGQMKHILSFIDTDAGLRNILTDLELLKAKPRADGRKNISQAASAYTTKFFGVSIKTYIQQARDGSLNEFHPVQRYVDLGPVPRLGKVIKNKCWHKPLAA